MEDGGKNNRAPFSLSPDAVNCAARRYNKNLLKLSCTYRGREEEGGGELERVQISKYGRPLISSRLFPLHFAKD